MTQDTDITRGSEIRLRGCSTNKRPWKSLYLYIYSVQTWSCKQRKRG